MLVVYTKNWPNYLSSVIVYEMKAFIVSHYLYGEVGVRVCKRSPVPTFVHSLHHRI